MLLVIDANIVLSSLIKGHLDDIIFSPKLELVAPELIHLEILNNEPAIRTKSGLTEVEWMLAVHALKNKIRTISIKEFFDRLAQAEMLLGDHKKDVPYAALALHLDCPFWTYEKRFIGKLRIISTAEVRKFVQG